jgi:hypothetical protein
MTANPYTLSKTPQMPQMQKMQNMPRNTGIGWYDFDEGVREQILSHSHPAKTVAVEWVAADSHLTLYEFTRERKRLAGPDLLKISITRNALTRDARTHTWHNVSRIRLHLFLHNYYDFEFVGKNADSAGIARRRRMGLRQPSYLAEDERSFYLPHENDVSSWMWPRRLYDKERHVFEELGLTGRA